MTNEIVPVDWRKRISTMVDAAGELGVVDQYSNLSATKIMQDMRGLADQITARRLANNRPHQDAINANNAEAKTYLDKLKEGTDHLNGASLKWEKEQRDIASAEEEAREESFMRAISDGKHEEANAHMEAAAFPVERPWRAPGTSLRVTWRAEVTDLRTYAAWAAHRLHEDKWLLPNQNLLDQEARAVKGESQIPGVRFVSTTTRASTSSGR